MSLNEICNCGYPKKVYQVRKDSPNKGKYFLSCPTRTCQNAFKFLTPQLTQQYLQQQQAQAQQQQQNPFIQQQQQQQPKTHPAFQGFAPIQQQQQQPQQAYTTYVNGPAVPIMADRMQSQPIPPPVMNFPITEPPPNKRQKVTMMMDEATRSQICAKLNQVSDKISKDSETVEADLQSVLEIVSKLTLTQAESAAKMNQLIKENNQMILDYIKRSTEAIQQMVQNNRVQLTEVATSFQRLNNKLDKNKPIAPVPSVSIMAPPIGKRKSSSIRKKKPEWTKPLSGPSSMAFEI